MGRLREINIKAQFAFSPVSTLVVTGTAAGSLSDDLSDDAKIQIFDPQLDNNDVDAFTLKAAGAVSTEDKCVSIAWGGVTAERPQGVVAAAMESGAVDLWDPIAILNGSSRDAALLNHTTAHTGTIKCVDFSTVQPNLLASAGTKGEFFVWDTAKPSSAPTSYRSTRLDEIISLAWNKKVGHIIALGGRSGALSLWDLRKKSELIHIPTRFSVSSITWHPTEATILCSASADDHNPVIQVWDLRNASAPKATLTGHEKAVLSVSWCSQDSELLLSSGADNRTLMWNPVSAKVVAELPVSGEWVHQVAWCRRQPHIVANATLDGKISLYSIQDTTTPAAAPIVDETPAGDDFFDSIPKNFQAQTSSFTLKQTPKWLKRTAGARFGFGGRLTQFSSKSVRVELSTQKQSSSVSAVASEIKRTLAEQNIKELCQARKADANESDKEIWDIIETLTSEHARDALRTYLGFSKEEIDKEVTQKFSSLTVNAEPEPELVAKESKPDKPDEPSVFGDSSAEDDFMGIINSEAPSRETAMTDFAEKERVAFRIYDEASPDSDKLITKAIFTGQFDKAIDVCLKEDRLSDAFMLALCGGSESQKRVQAAYFKKTTVPYGRLLSSIVDGNLVDVIQMADLQHWKEILAILCNYAKPDQFLFLCEALGHRLEQSGHEQSAAVLCYLAGEKLEHLVRIWSTSQSKVEREALQQENSPSIFDLHTAGLSKIIEKISIFRKAVSFVDSQVKSQDKYKLSGLYTLYLEYAQLIANEGDSTLAAEYLALVPSTFEGADALKKRITEPAKPASAGSAYNAQKTTGMRPTGMRNVYTQPAVAVENPIGSPGPRAASAYAPQPQIPAVPVSPAVTNPSATAARSAPIQNPYAPVQTQSGQQNGTTPSSYGQQQTTYQSPGTYSQPAAANGQFQPPAQIQQQSQFSAFAPPPSRITSNGPAILPAAQRKDITPWNDAPDMPLPAPRRATPAINRANITSPFQAAPSPTLQGFGPPQAQALAPPPKTRSPAPTRAAPAETQPVPQSRPVSSAYAPPPPAQAQGPTNPPQMSRSTPNAYAPPPNQFASAAASGYVNQQSLPPQQQQPPQQQPVNHAPPPATFAPPPRVASGPPKAGPPRAGPPAGIAASARQVNLSPEPSRQSSPVQEKFEFPQARYPPGDRSHMPESDRPIEQTLTEMTARLQAIAPEKYRRPLDDTEKRFAVLFDLLNNTQLTDGTREQLRIASAALARADWETAYTIHQQLTTDKMHECRAWIAGIKTLVVVGKRSIAENWQ